jgi:peptidoglycan biosynthesis protein MviN/MurJ (putative lipid II flippase)
VGHPHGQRIQQTAVKATAAALVMGAGVWWLAHWLTPRLPAGLVGELLVVAIAAGAGGAFYVLAMRVLGVTEVVGLINAAAHWSGGLLDRGKRRARG